MKGTSPGLETLEQLKNYGVELKEELRELLEWWERNMVDNVQGGFYGTLSNENIADNNSPRGIVLYSRILWTFSAAGNYSDSQQYVATAQRAFLYIKDHFIDKEHGGVFWSVDQDGKMLDGKKQIYGLAFCIYALAEYYSMSKDQLAIDLAKQLFDYVEKYSFDPINRGYTEAFTREWMPIDDLRLSDKDDNEKKTMNTHLHIVEAYANLYRSWPSVILRKKIIDLLEVFEQYFLDITNGHLRLFFTEWWRLRSTLRSFGHEIEASWLLYECAVITGDKTMIDRYKKISVQSAIASLDAVDSDGGLWYEYDPPTNKWIKEKHWWPQAEAMVGFFNAWELTGDEKFLQQSISSWAFIKKELKDTVHGEWFWGIGEDGSVMQKEKAGFWKCPYHNGRACMEVLHRIYQYE